jgi:hypothetical protein
MLRRRWTEDAGMARATVSEAAPQPGRHGPIAGAVKWAFKSYIRARRVVNEAVAEAQHELRAATAPEAHLVAPLPVVAPLPAVAPLPVAGGSDVEPRMRRRISAHGEPLAAPPRRQEERPVVRWLSAGRRRGALDQSSA